jgi:hypothetical protein
MLLRWRLHDARSSTPRPPPASREKLLFELLVDTESQCGFRHGHFSGCETSSILHEQIQCRVCAPWLWPQSTDISRNFDAGIWGFSPNCLCSMRWSQVSIVRRYHSGIRVSQCLSDDSDGRATHFVTEPLSARTVGVGSTLTHNCPGNCCLRDGSSTIASRSDQTQNPFAFRELREQRTIHPECIE